MAEQHQVRSWGESEKDGKRKEYDLIINGRKVPLNLTCKVSPAAYSFRNRGRLGWAVEGRRPERRRKRPDIFIGRFFLYFLLSYFELLCNQGIKVVCEVCEGGIGRHLKRKLQSRTTQLQCRTNTFLFVQIKVEFVSDKMHDCSVKHTRVTA